MAFNDYKTEKIQTTRYLVNLFLETNASDIELSKRVNMSSSTIGRRLTNKNDIIEAFPNNGEELYNIISERRQQNLQRGKAIGSQVSKLNTSDGDFENIKFRLDIFYRSREKQLIFLMHIALTFRLKLSTLSELFQIDEDELMKDLLKISGGAEQGLLFLFYSDYTDQETAKREFIEYYREFITAIRNKDAARQKELAAVVFDIKANNVKKERQKDGTITDENIGIILAYQLKYALNHRLVASIFSISGSYYLKRVKKYLEDKPELRARYEYLADAKKRHSGDRRQEGI